MRLFKVGNPIAPQMGHLRFSIDESGAQRMIAKQQALGEVLSQNTLERLMRPAEVNATTVLLSMSTSLLPVKIMQLMKAMGLEKDLLSFCLEVVICSDLLIEIAQIGNQPVYDFCPGFVNEGDPESPYYAEGNDPALISLTENFIASPGETIFINYKFTEQNSDVADHFSLSPLLAYFLGFIKSEVKLLFAIANLEESQQVAISYPLRAFYAARHLLLATENLKGHAEEYSTLHKYAKTQFSNNFGQLSEAERRTALNIISSLGL